MAEFILIIDDRERMQAIAEAATDAANVQVITVATLSEAKRKLLQAAPTLVLCNIVLQEDTEAGFRFCKELQGHEALRAIPVILIAEIFSAEIVRKASASGAKSLMLWPVAPETLHSRLLALSPQGISSPTKTENLFPGQQKTEKSASPTFSMHASFHSAEPMPRRKNFHEEKQQKNGESEALPKSLEADSTLTDLEKKLRIAQNLLAKVLHNLKTSDLLQIIEIEDVARVVFEMTRKVCGVPSIETAGQGIAEQKETVKSELSSGPNQSNLKDRAETADIQLDLDQIFGLKQQ